LAVKQEGIMEIAVRPLKTKDIKTLAAIIGKLNQEEVKAITGKIKEKADRLELGLAIIRLVSDDVAGSVFGWLADMAGMTPEEFDNTEPHVLKEVVSKVVEQAGFRDFLSSAGSQAGETTSTE